MELIAVIVDAGDGEEVRIPIDVLDQVLTVKHKLLGATERAGLLQRLHALTPEEANDVFQAVETHTDNKIQAIKAVRGLLSVGLKEAKDIVDAAWRIQGL